MFRVGFLGRGRLGLHVLEGLLKNPAIEVPVIISCAATPEVEDNAGRMQEIALKRGIDYFATNLINKPEWEPVLAAYKLDLVVAMLWLHTIDERIISTSRLGFINCHGGHLPKYRGNACANWAILNGEPHIGTSVHLMVPGQLDNGPVILQDQVEIKPDSYIGELIEELEYKGERLVLKAVEAIRTGRADLIQQDERIASYCYPRIPRDGEIDWTKPADRVLRLIRSAGHPYPGAYTWFMDHRDKGAIRRMIVWRAHVETHPLSEFYAVPGHLIRLSGGTKWAIACGDGLLLVLEEIEVDGVSVQPSTYFRTVRQRMGLDLSLLVADNRRRIEVLEESLSLERTAARFHSTLASELELIEVAVSDLVERAGEQLRNEEIGVELNPLRNYSFQRRWFDWERRERWFGVQVYRSLRLTGLAGEPIAIGYWCFTADSGALERRIYLAITEGHQAILGAQAERLFRSHFTDLDAVVRYGDGHVQGMYVRVPRSSIEVICALIKLARSAYCELKSIAYGGANR
jgi:methionyl-tRNA formyltransferase